MKPTLVYNPQLLRYEVEPSLEERLIKERLCYIEDYGKIQKAFGKGPITTEQFEELMTVSLHDLRQAVWDQSALLQHIKAAERGSA